MKFCLLLLQEEIEIWHILWFCKLETTKLSSEALERESSTSSDHGRMAMSRVPTPPPPEMSCPVAENWCYTQVSRRFANEFVFLYCYCELLGFLSNTGWTPWKITKLSSQYSMLAHHHHSNKTPFKWRLLAAQWWPTSSDILIHPPPIN